MSREAKFKNQGSKGQVMHFDPHQTTHEQPVPEQWPPGNNPQRFLLIMVPNGMEYPFHLGSSVVAVFLPNTWLNSQTAHWWGI